MWGCGGGGGETISVTSYLLVYKESLPKCMDMGTRPWVSDIFAMERQTRREREKERHTDRQTDKTDK